MSEKETFPEARFLKPDGTEQVVQGWGPLREGNVRYDKYVHKDHIKCLCCNAAMRLQEGSAAAGGSSGTGRTSYFTPVKKHEEDCIRALHRPAPVEQKIDRTKGYRIHINTRQFSSEFNKRSGVYEVSAEGHVIAINDPDLKDREVYVVKDIQDMIALMKKADGKRLSDSKVIFGNESIDWKDFCIPFDMPARYRKLTARAITAKGEDELPFALMEIHTTKGRVFRGFSPQAGSNIPASRIDFGRDKRGIIREIEPSADIKNRDNTHVMWGFQDAGTYLVMGVVRHHTFEGDRRTIEYLNVSVDHPGQFQKASMENIRREARAYRGMAPEKGPKAAPSGP